MSEKIQAVNEVLRSCRQYEDALLSPAVAGKQKFAEVTAAEAAVVRSCYAMVAVPTRKESGRIIGAVLLERFDRLCAANGQADLLALSQKALAAIEAAPDEGPVPPVAMEWTQTAWPFLVLAREACARAEQQGQDLMLDALREAVRSGPGRLTITEQIGDQIISEEVIEGTNRDDERA